MGDISHQCFLCEAILQEVGDLVPLASQEAASRS